MPSHHVKKFGDLVKTYVRYLIDRGLKMKKEIQWISSNMGVDLLLLLLSDRHLFLLLGRKHCYLFLTNSYCNHCANFPKPI